VVVRGATPASARYTLLTARELNAHNTFEAPDAVAPTSGAARVSAGTVVVTVPPKSVMKVEIPLA
jgi:alpha-N-arabinofuranosidase